MKLIYLFCLDQVEPQDILRIFLIFLAILSLNILINYILIKKSVYILESEKISVWYNENDILGKCDYVPILVDNEKEEYIM